MPDYFALTPEGHRDLYEGVQGRLPWSAKLLEKDVWVCWTLKALFDLENAPNFAFKGGTSLSKVYNVIHRFSEDVDITINPDHDALEKGFNPIDTDVSKTKLRKQGKRVAKEILPDYIRDTLRPQLKKLTETLPQRYRPRVAYNETTPEALELIYPSSLPKGNRPDYVEERVLIEFGARATTEPSHTREVAAYLQAVPELNEVAFPKATVNVLSAERTFWEKATLIHFENTRNNGPRMRERYARHWYDLYQLSKDPTIGPSARADTKTRDHVLTVKTIHYGGGGVDYKACAQGGLRLKPQPEYARKLEQDFDAMRSAGMFVKEPPSFETILTSLADLEAKLNA